MEQGQADEAGREKEQHAGPVMPGFPSKGGADVFGQDEDAADAEGVGQDADGQGADGQDQPFPHGEGVCQVSPGNGNHKQSHEGTDAGASLSDAEIIPASCSRTDFGALNDGFHAEEGGKIVGELGGNQLHAHRGLLQARKGNAQQEEEERNKAGSGDLIAGVIPG